MDYGGQSGPAVVPNPYDEGFLMAYTALDEELMGAFYGKWNVGLAESKDGITWSRIGDQPIFAGRNHWQNLLPPSCSCSPFPPFSSLGREPQAVKLVGDHHSGGFKTFLGSNRQRCAAQGSSDMDKQS